MSEPRGPSGLVVIDKPSGPTSHDVVSRVRRALGTRRVGHAGTLDPMASGVLVVLVGEATKLAAFATAEDKRYVGRVAFGRSTDTLDAVGATVEERPTLLPPRDALLAALEVERARTAQIPPAFSAIQRDGKRSYELARAGKEVALPPRPVEVRRLALLRAESPAPPELPFVELEIDVGKGYYVRSLARDLGLALGVPAHLAALRRVASGAFGLEEAVPLDDAAGLQAALRPIEATAARLLPVASLTEDGVLRARQGKRLGPSDFIAPAAGAGPTAWLGPGGELCAIGRTEQDVSSVLRGFPS